MKSTIEYTDEPLGDLKVIDDLLPPPEQLAFKEETVKVTISLSKIRCPQTSSGRVTGSSSGMGPPC